MGVGLAPRIIFEATIFKTRESVFLQNTAFASVISMLERIDRSIPQPDFI